MVLLSNSYQRLYPETVHNRLIYGAFTLAIILHLAVAVSFGWIQIPALALPVKQSLPVQHFIVHSVSIPPLPSSSSTPAQVDVPTPSEPAVLNPGPLIPDSPIIQNQPISQPDLRQDLVPAQIEPTVGNSDGGGSKPGELPGINQAIEAMKLPPVDTSNLPKPIVVPIPTDVLFAFDQATLLPEATPKLQEAADKITRYHQANIQVDGYTDSIGQPDYNQKLSELRAQAVAQWLTAHVPQGRYNFNASGHGSTNYMVEPTGTKEQQAQNRRVELLIQAIN